ncbi:hypothetical protein BDD12DRAFT_835623 [Trichophaea hybrida]|nr:hypothetical protein BDD12DRAFT_835623 [Trichophaea hybrida]
MQRTKRPPPPSMPTERSLAAESYVQSYTMSCSKSLRRLPREVPICSMPLPPQCQSSH